MTMIRVSLAVLLAVTAVGLDGRARAGAQQGAPAAPIPAPVITVPDGAAAVEQTTAGTKPAAELVASFDGLGVGFEGPQGTAALRNPSDNSLAVGPDHIVQTAAEVWG